MSQKTSVPKKKIAQSTFDDLVRECIVDLDMEPSEAVADAKKQLEAQNVDLALIVKDLYLNPSLNVEEIREGKLPRHAIVNALDQIRLLTSQLESSITNAQLSDWQSTQLLQALALFSTQCTKSLAHRVLAGQTSALDQLVALLRATLPQDLSSDSPDNAVLLPVAVASLGALADLLSNQGDLIVNRQADFERLVAVVSQAAALQSDTSKSRVSALLANNLRALRNSCEMHEGNRDDVVSLHLLEATVRLMQTWEPIARAHKSACSSSSTSSGAASSSGSGSGASACAVLVEASRLLRTFTVDDDPRVPFCRAHDRARLLVEDTPALEFALRLCTGSEWSPEELSEFLRLVSALSVRNEYCTRILETGGLTLLFDLIRNHSDNLMISKASLGLLKVLAGSDEVKEAFGSAGGLSAVLAILSDRVSDAGVCEAALGLLAMVCLRRPDYAQQLVAMRESSNANAPPPASTTDSSAPIASASGATLKRFEPAAAGDASAAPSESPLVQLVVRALSTHRDAVGVQRQASFLVRNVVSRSPQLRAPFLMAGVEPLLTRLSQLPNQSVADPARAALRDLGLLKLAEEWHSQGLPAAPPIPK